MDKKVLIVIVIVVLMAVAGIGYLMMGSDKTTTPPSVAVTPPAATVTTPSTKASTTATNNPSNSTPPATSATNTASTNQTSTLPQTTSTANTPSNTSTNTTSSGNTNVSNTGTTQQVLVVNPLENKPLIHTIPIQPIILKLPEPVLIDAKEYPPTGNINWMNDPTDTIVGLRGISYNKKKYSAANNSYGNGEYVTWGNTMADNNQYAVQGLFDKNINWVYSSNAGWHTGWGDLYSNTADSATPAEVYIKLPKPIVLTAYEIYPRGDGGALAQTQGPIKWILQGSNDNVNYSTINSQDNISGWTNLQSKMFPVTTTTKYNHYKWVFYRVGSNNANIVLNEIKLYGYE